MKKLSKIIIFIVLSIFCLLAFLTIYYSHTIPSKYKLFVGQNLNFNYLGVKFSRIEDLTILNRKSKQLVEDEFYKAKLLNLIPIKNIVVKKYNKTHVIPCGTPFGVKFLTDGVMVVDTQEIITNNEIKNPSKDAGLKKGDIIESINGEKISSNSDLKTIILNACGEKMQLEFYRNFKKLKTTLTPVLVSKEKKWLTGLWVRDSSAGIGTTTFCTEEGIFGGLGHAICDVDTGKKLPLGSGEIVKATIEGIKKGICGSPGELSGVFSKNETIGNVKINDDRGLYGKLYNPIILNKPVMIGFKQDAKAGKAEMLCTIQGDKPKKYDILIESIDKKANSRNFVIKIVDKELLEKTGGIVQGMSGSPIIQNDKFIGAVTHVFLNDSKRGYGIFAETMLEIANEA